jgi:hypothetical protein
MDIRTRLLGIATVLLGSLTSCSTPVDTAGEAAITPPAAIADPLPDPVEKQGLAVEIRDVARLPETRGLRPPDEDVNPAGWARVSFVRDLPDGRRFANDSRGFLYLLGDEGPTVYASFEDLTLTVYNRLESGFIGFDFHPEFASNGLFYTVHSERGPGNPAPADFIPPGFAEADVTYHNVITEWRAADPSADTFSGTRRTLLRVAHIVDTLTHPFGYVGFNPTAAPGDEDHGLLYTSGSDTGFSNGAGPNGRNPGQLQRLDTLIGAILRIDPQSPGESGGIAGIGDYTIPANNPYAGDDDPETLGEIYASGFRNAHRLSWDLEDGTLFATDIGMSHIEEVNIVRAGGNYGWMQREGYFDNGINFEGFTLDEVFPLPADVLSGETPDPFTYPVAVYDHDEGRAISGGFTYHGPIPALQGKFIFGDVNNGRVFAADVTRLKAADDDVPETVAPIEEVQLYVRDARGERRDISFRDLVEETFGETARADLHISRGRNGEILLTSRQDGMIRQLVEDTGGIE